MKLILNDQIFGKLMPLIDDEHITDINWNGEALWINDLNRGRYPVEGLRLDAHFIDQFSQYLANLMNASFNMASPILEAETEGLRISILHESVTATGRSISIRKTPAIMRLCRKKMKDTGYCSEKIANFHENCIRAKLSTVFSGLPGVGKTELLKASTAYISREQRVITIEDNLEIRYRKINPGKDCIELKVDNKNFTYPKAIRASLRQLPEWILLSEARSSEVKYLLESMSTGTHCLTTLHTDDVRKIPDRILNMMPDYRTSTINDIYSFIDMGIQIRSFVRESGIERRIAQIALFSRNENQNKIYMLYDEGLEIEDEFEKLPPDIRLKFELAGIYNPFRPYSENVNK